MYVALKCPKTDEAKTDRNKGRNGQFDISQIVSIIAKTNRKSAMMQN